MENQKQLYVLAYALVGLIDNEAHDKNENIIRHLNAGTIVDYLRKKHADQMPLLTKTNFEGVNEAIVASCGGDANIYLQKYPKTNNGLCLLLNLVLNALWTGEDSAPAE